MNFILRDFRAEDFETLWRIDQECFAPGIAYSRRELSAYLRRRGAFAIVAEVVRPGETPGTSRDAQTAGIAGFIVAEASRRGVGHIISIDVLPESRRCGLGSQLLTAAEDRLRAVPCYTVVLETAVDNISALSFYKRHQYAVVQVAPRYYPNGMDAFLLVKDLVQKSRSTGRAI